MEQPEKTLRVLIVEDSEDDAELILNELRQGGYRPINARVDSAESLRAALDGAPWDLVICDHSLPALDAPVAQGIMRNLGLAIPFIIVSGTIADQMAVDLMRQGAVDMIRKDNLSKLVPVIERELRKAVACEDLRQARELIHRVADYDRLTGLPNREFLFRHLDEMIAGHLPHEKLAVLLINLNRFRLISSTLGILAGNQVLQMVADRLRESLGAMSFIARLGGDRFVVVLPHLVHGGKGEATAVLDVLHEKCDEAMDIERHELFITCSIGISLFPDHGLVSHALVGNAESAMYQARESGGCNYRFFEQDDASGHDSLLLEHSLHRALTNKEFLVYYQPQFDLSAGKIVGVEALLRWRHPEYGLMPPTRFVPLLEETGLIVPVGEWVLEAACAKNREWQDAGLAPIRVAVNLSAIQFQQPGLTEMVRKVLARTGLDPEWLELEITENIAMHNEEAIIATLSELRAMGVSLAIDDFGTGYSSLAYLKRFPIDKLKVDQCFVRDISREVDDGAIVKAVIAMARSLGLSVIAEGVELEEQVAFLRQQGCREVQGFLFGRPMSAENMAVLLGAGCMTSPQERE